MATKTEDLKQIPVRLTPDKHAELKRAAEKDNRSVQGQLRYLIERYLKQAR
jgi:hypothetical protein